MPAFATTDTAVFDSEAVTYQLSIAENSRPGTVIGRITHNGGSPDFRVYGVTGQHAGLVTVDDDGTVRLAEDASLNHEALDSLSLDFTAIYMRDDGTMVMEITEGSVINVTDADDGVVIQDTDAIIDVPSPMSAGSVVTRLRASDEDGDTVSWQVVGQHRDKFSIDADGTLRVREGTVLDGDDFPEATRAIAVKLEASSTHASGVTSTASKDVVVTFSGEHDYSLASPMSIHRWMPNPGGPRPNGTLPIRPEEFNNFVDSGGNPITSLTISKKEDDPKKDFSMLKLNVASGYKLNQMKLIFGGEPSLGQQEISPEMQAIQNKFARLMPDQLALKLKPGTALDHENTTEAKFSFYVGAVFVGRGLDVKYLKVNIITEDGPDPKPTFTFRPVIDDDAGENSYAGEVKVENADGLSTRYEIFNADGRTPSDMFAINAMGQIYLKRDIDVSRSTDIAVKVKVTVGDETFLEDHTFRINATDTPSPATTTINLGDQFRHAMTQRDSDGDAFRYVDTTSPRPTIGGSYEVVGGQLVYTPRKDFIGNDTLTVQVQDRPAAKPKAGDIVTMKHNITVKPDLSTLEGATTTITWVMLGYADGGAGLSIRFASLPTEGKFVLVSGSRQSDVTTSTRISHDDIVAGKLKFIAGADLDAAKLEVINVSILKPSGLPTETHKLSIETRDVEMTPIQHIKDSDGGDSQHLSGIQNLTFIEVGDRTFLVTAASGDDALSVFTLGRNDTELQQISSLQDSSASLLALDGVTDIASVTINGVVHLYAAGADEDGISHLTLGRDGVLTPVGSVRDADNSDYALDGVNSLSLARVGDAHYLIAAGKDDTGFSVFRIGADGGLSHVDSITSPVGTAGSPIQLTGNIFGTIAESGGATFYVASIKDKDAVAVYRIDADGDMTLTDTVVRDTSASPPELLDIPLFSSAFQIGDKSFVAIPACLDHTLTLYELSSTGQLTQTDRATDPSSNSDLVFNETMSTAAFVLDGQHYVAVGGIVDQGFSLFRVDGDGKLTWVESIRDDTTLNLKGKTRWAFTPNGDEGLIMAASGKNDNGFSLFEMDLEPYLSDLIDEASPPIIM